MQEPPKHRPRPSQPRPADPDARPDELRPRRVIAPLVPVLLVVVLGFLAGLVALVLLPLFASAGMGVNAFRDRLDAAGVGRVQIPRPPERSVIYAADGSELATVFLNENRRIVKLENVAKVAQQAVLAIEDSEFYEHGALDFPGLIRAAVTNLASGEIEQGASTISQQVVKNVLIDTPSQTFARKFQEASLAIRLERRYTKDEILGIYLNEVYFGNGAYGIGTASETYFRKPPGQLRLAEAALLAGIIQAPGTYDPLTNPEGATARRDVAIDRMLELGWIGERKAERAKATPLEDILSPDAGPPEQKVEPFFVYYIKNLILENESGEFDAFGATRNQRVRTLYQGGLRIYTTLEPEWQRYAQEAVDASPYISPTEGPDVSIVSVDATTGAIKAMLSGKNYRRDQIDLVWHGTRQVGSAFKPFTLAAAFREGFPPGQVYSSASPQCGLEGWISASGCVSNAEGGGDAGYMDLWTATQNSVNVVFAQLALDVGAEHIVETAHLMGVTSALDAVPSITLGVEEVSTLDMATGYSTLANDGVHCEPFAVARVMQPKGEDEETGGWETLYRHRAQCEQVIDPDIAHLVTAMLQRVVSGGTGTAAAIGRPVAGKTGTAQDYTNVYFAGYTPQVATAVWVGFSSGQIPMDTYYGGSVFGGTVAAPIWHDFMVRAMQGYPVEGFESPPAPVRGTIPDVVGLRSDEAQALLVEANFTPIVEKVVSFEPPNTVLSQAPGGGTSAVLGSAVTLQVSNGKGEAIAVPRVTGMTEADAVKALEKLGLIAAIEYVPVDDPDLDGIVLSQVPIGDGEKLVDLGATVTLQVGRLGGGNDGGGDNGGAGDDGGGGGDRAVTPPGRRAAL
jgi:membrane peptidoglycan carboxypeptidase